VRGQRLGAGLTQAQLAARAGVSRQWVSELEHGKPTAELGLVLALLDTLRLSLDVRDEGEYPASQAADLDAVLEEHRGAV
jgi:HTH-type transcriptional regulator/antitoxin HipB